jgi:excisionase family DNA binding protein
LQVADPALFVNKIVGAQGIFETPQIVRFLRGIIVAKLTDLLGELGKGLFDLPALYDEIGAGARAKVQDDFAALGVQLKTLYVTSISPTEETAKAIDERASIGAIGDMDAYMKFQTARGIRAAAESGGGGAGDMAGMGAGMGAGMAMAQAMGQSMSGGGQQQAPAAAAPAGPREIMTLSEAAAYIRVGEEDVLAIIDSGELKAKKIGTSYRISKKAIDEYLAS